MPRRLSRCACRSAAPARCDVAPAPLLARRDGDDGVHHLPEVVKLQLIEGLGVRRAQRQKRRRPSSISRASTMAPMRARRAPAATRLGASGSSAVTPRRCPEGLSRRPPRESAGSTSCASIADGPSSVAHAQSSRARRRRAGRASSAQSRVPTILSRRSLARATSCSRRWAHGAKGSTSARQGAVTASSRLASSCGMARALPPHLDSAITWPQRTAPPAGS